MGIHRKIILLVFFIWIFTGCSSETDEFLQKEKNISKIIAHQGNWQYEGWERNSVEALRSALQWRFYGTKCDVGMTKDSTFIIRHDDLKEIIQY